MNDTPETDSVKSEWQDGWSKSTGREEFENLARRLERERDEARGIAAFYRSRSCESQEDYDEHKFSWENDQEQPPTE